MSTGTTCAGLTRAEGSELKKAARRKKQTEAQHRYVRSHRSVGRFYVARKFTTLCAYGQSARTKQTCARRFESLTRSDAHVWPTTPVCEAVDPRQDTWRLKVSLTCCTPPPPPLRYAGTSRAKGAIRTRMGPSSGLLFFVPDSGRVAHPAPGVPGAQSTSQITLFGAILKKTKGATCTAAFGHSPLRLFFVLPHKPVV